MNTTTKTENKTTAKQALFTAIMLTVVCIASVIVSGLLIGTIAPLVGSIVVMAGCCYTVFKRYIEIRREELKA